MICKQELPIPKCIASIYIKPGKGSVSVAFVSVLVSIYIGDNIYTFSPFLSLIDYARPKNLGWGLDVNSGINSLKVLGLLSFNPLSYAYSIACFNSGFWLVMLFGDPRKNGVAVDAILVLPSPNVFKKLFRYFRLNRILIYYRIWCHIDHKLFVYWILTYQIFF